ncbi:MULTISPECIES: LexA family protein [Paenibacillus]|nr:MULTISPECIES: MarR family transcriptional regulator [Paenibacillus]ETT55819.1 repressor lexA [Paenibacillus sp. FSL H8-237]
MEQMFLFYGVLYDFSKELISISELTRREKDALNAINNLYDRLKYSPTVQEIADEMGLSSKSTAFRYIQGLEEKGYLERKESSPRALRVIRHVK